MEGERKSMLTVRCAELTALHEAVRGLLAGFALAEVGVTVDGSFEAPGITVQLQDSPRWMCVVRGEQDVQTARWALANGVWCLASLEGPMSQFEDATRSLIQGSPHHLPVSFARLIANGGQAQPPTHTPPPATDLAAQTRLTAREREVLRCLAEGLSNAEIAARLSISVHTVRTHLASMATKIDADSRLRLVAKAHRLGYAEAEVRSAD